MAYRLLRAKRLIGEPKAVASALTVGRTPATYSSQAETVPPRGWQGDATPGPAPAPGVGDGLPVRRHRRWAAAEVPHVIDEHNRLCRAIRVGRRCKAKDVLMVLEAFTCVYPAPTYITGRSSLPTPSRAGPTTAAPTRPTSSQDPPGRMALPNHSTAG